MASLPLSPEELDLKELGDRAAGRGIAIRPLTAGIGAEIRGLDLENPLSPEDWGILRAAWLRWKVVLIRDTDISHEAHIRLGRLFGELEGHPVIPHVPGHPEILSIRGVEGVKPTPETIEGFRAYNKWHTDVTFRQKPSIASLLRARLLPPVGGDTLFADTAAAWRGLPDAVKERIETLDAEHDIVRSFGGRVTEERREQLRRDFPAVRHPVVRRHPETGEKILYVNYTFTSRILDIDPSESEQLLRLLFDRIKVPEYQVRLSWTPNAIAIWDNRSTQHYAVGDYFPADRVLERVTVSGDVVSR
ncbi:TauD/TfdA family dioxygenase [Sandaracinobacter sp. RS1-74]|uniref:TauD/TfdA dioxygenase family protein n=1 Tax=Sandaracinobacteroides sayramensis TaxID=2913411 RepID=UPI001EDA44B0|nr:TauD/TfdA family dioxygenase [Sandaracinobacteroides sayramensis]MCG2842110.1 TauD/TfdA family dioxygenase [Sandaracinobacteroides sayramensis]